MMKMKRLPVIGGAASKCRTGFAISRILSAAENSTPSARGDYSSESQVTLNPYAILPGSLLLVAVSPFRLTESAVASLFDLAPRRVWLFSLQQLPSGVPFPARRSMLWTFSLFHCSSPYDGGSLTPALPYGVRTFLNTSYQNEVALELTQNIATACRSWGGTIPGAARYV